MAHDVAHVVILFPELGRLEIDGGHEGPRRPALPPPAKQVARYAAAASDA